MTKTVTVVDYGVGNLRSVTRGFEYCGAEVVLTSAPRTIMDASHLVLPGVGAFADGMRGLRERHLIDPIRRYAASGRPFLGICLGMQMMLQRTEEFGIHEGLGLIAGSVVAIPRTAANGASHKIPHIGWAPLGVPTVRAGWDGTILGPLAPGATMYFVHSYMAMPDDPAHYLAVCDYNGRTVTAAIQAGSLYGCQFHPEKSAQNGLAVLQRFLEC